MSPLSLSLSLPATTEARYHQDIAKLGKRTLLNLDDVGPEECLPLMEILKTSIDQVRHKLEIQKIKLRALLLLIYCKCYFYRSISAVFCFLYLYL